MKRGFVISKILFLLSSCGQSFNSNTGDIALTAINLTSCIKLGTSARVRYCAAQVIIRNKCINCHFGYHSQWSSYTNDAAWIDSGKVVARSTTSSALITRLKNQGGNMPSGASQISDEDYQILLDWVKRMP